MLGERRQDLLREGDDIVEDRDIYSSDQKTGPQSVPKTKTRMLRTVVAIVGLLTPRDKLSLIRWRVGSWGRHLEEGIRREESDSLCTASVA